MFPFPKKEHDDLKAGFPLRFLLFILCICLCVFSGWKIYGIFSEYRQGEQSYADLTNQFVAAVSAKDTPQQQAGSAVPTAAGESETAAAETQAAETAPVSVDFDALLAACPDVVGWLFCPDTPINYPVLQSGDNSYYLYRLMDGSSNSSGSIFVDYRNTEDFSDWNTIVYGHNMKNDSMFGTLEEYKSQEYYDAHPVLYLLTPAQDYKIELISGYTTSGNSTSTYAFPVNQDERDGLIATAQARSTFQTATAAADGERIVTLSTCAYEYDNARYVLVGVLRELPRSN